MDLYTSNNFTVVRQIADPSDVTTYYLQAVIRNAYTDEILKTLNLTSKGSQRYKGDWKVPPDPSGQGFYVSIVTSVYTDSGYTTKSTNYGDEENTYLVVDRPAVKNGTSAGSTLGRRDIRDIVSEELAKILPQIMPKEVEEAEPDDDIDYTPQFTAIMEAISAIPKVEKAEKVDFSPVLNALKGIQEAFTAFESKNDISSIVAELKDHMDTNEVTLDEAKSLIEGMKNDLLESVKKSVAEAVRGMNFVTSFITHAATGKEAIAAENPIEPKKKEPIDISKLTE